MGQELHLLNLLRTLVYYLNLGHEGLLIVFFFLSALQCLLENEKYSAFAVPLESCSASDVSSQSIS